jgi:SAM-dependent methyltransferase
MPFQDKKDIISNLRFMENVILDLGCGQGKKNSEWIGIDALDYEGVDIVGDVFEILEKFPDETVDEVHSYHFFEHINDIPKLLQLLQKILKSDGKIVVVVPHFSNPYFYSDYTHKNFFGLYSFSYLTKDDIFKRKVPNYNVETGLYLKQVNLHFSSPFRYKQPFKRLYQFLFNITNGLKEFYEESCCYLFPCYELKYILVRKNPREKV